MDAAPKHPSGHLRSFNNSVGVQYPFPIQSLLISILLKKRNRVMRYSPQFFLTSNIAPTFSNKPATTPALSPSPPSSTVGRAILTSSPSQAYAEGYPSHTPSQAYAEGYPSHGPIMTAISDFKTPQTTSYATIRPSTPIVIGSSLWLYPTGLMNSSVPSEYKAFPTGVEFEDGATRRGGFSLGSLVAVILLGTVLARHAF